MKQSAKKGADLCYGFLTVKTGSHGLHRTSSKTSTNQGGTKMCDFFSYIQDKDGKIYYFDIEARKQLVETGVVRVQHGDSYRVDDPISTDSHSAIAFVYLGKHADVRSEDGCNKFEIGTDGVECTCANSNLLHLVKEGKKWGREFSKSKEFEDMCMLELQYTDYDETRSILDISSMIDVRKIKDPETIDKLLFADPSLIRKFPDYTPGTRAQIEILRYHLPKKYKKTMTCDLALDFVASRGHLPHELMTESRVLAMINGGFHGISDIKGLPKKLLTDKVLVAVAHKYRAETLLYPSILNGSDAALNALLPLLDVVILPGHMVAALGKLISGSGATVLEKNVDIFISVCERLKFYDTTTHIKLKNKLSKLNV